MRGAGVARAACALITPVVGAARAQRVVSNVFATLLLVLHYLSAQYARALLGLAWVLVTPALLLAVYLPVLLYVFRAEPPRGWEGATDFGLFLLTGFLPWGAFSEAFAQGAQSIVSQASLVRHAPLPPIMLPIVKVTAAFMGLLVSSALFLLVLTAMGRFPGVRVVLLLPVVGLLYLFVLGAAWLVSSVSVYVRDVLQITPTILLIQFFACPIVYSPEQAPGGWGLLVRLNPLTPFLALYRAALAPQAVFAWADLAAAAGWAAAMFALGWLVFRWLQDGFNDAL